MSPLTATLFFVQHLIEIELKTFDLAECLCIQVQQICIHKKNRSIFFYFSRDETPDEGLASASSTIQDAQTPQLLTPQRMTPEQALKHQPGINNSLIDIDR